MRRSTADYSASVAAAIMQGPCSAKLICIDVGLHESKTDRIKPYIAAFKSKGLIYISAYTVNGWPVYAWQPKPWENLDALKPISKQAARLERRNHERVENQTAPSV